MMSFSQVKSAGGAHDYYANKDNYYVLGSLEEHWFGKGAEELGLSGAIDKETFTNVLEGKLPDGSDLTHMSGDQNKHRPGYDLTFSAPKSVSMMALIGGDKRLIEAHNQAVAVAMKEVEALASVRSMKDGKSQTVITGNLVVAMFNHDTSRDLDPQLHTHAVVANATKHDGKWQALSSDTVGKTGFSETILANQIALGQIYRHALRPQVEAMGYELEEVGKHGMWEMKGVPTEVFSKRHQAIDEVVGLDASQKSRSIAALDTRKAKVASDPAALVVDWRAQAKAAGFDIDAYRQDAGTRTLRVPEPPKLEGDAQVLATEAVGKAISLLSDRQVQFTWSELLAKTVSQLPAEPGVFGVAKQGLENAIEKQRLIPLDREKGIFTSDIHLLDELSIKSLSQEISRNGKVSIDPSKSVPREAPYSDAVSVLAQDKPGIAVLSGIGGAAVQRNRVAEVVTMAKEQGREVNVLASDNHSRKYLAADDRLGDAVLAGHAALKSGLAFTPNSTLIVDQAEKYTLKEMVNLLDGSLRNNVQLVMMDTQQRKGTGNALSVLKDAGINRYQFKGGQQVNVNIASEPDKVQRFERLARDYASAVGEGIDSVAQVNGVRDQKVLNDQVRDALKQKGILDIAETKISVLTPVWLDSKSRTSRDSYREGMVMEQYDSEKKTRERYVIDRITPRSNSLTLANSEGDTQVVRISQLDSSWSLFNSGSIPVAEGERVRVLGRENEGQAKGGDMLHIQRVANGAIEAKKVVGGNTIESEKALKLPIGETPFTALKLAHGYVESLGGSVSDKTAVFAATAARELNTDTLNRMARSGPVLSLYSAIDSAKTTEKLARNPHYRVVSDQVKSIAGVESLPAAMDQLHDSLHTPAQQAIHLAIPTLEGNQLAFTQTKLLSAALGFSEKGTEIADIKSEIAHQIKSGELINIEAVAGFGVDLLVSRKTFETEKSIIRHIAEGKDALAPLIPQSSRAAAIGTLEGLTEGQQRATNLILTSTDRFVAIQGYAGVGKTTQFRSVLNSLGHLPKEQQPKVVGLAPTHRAVHEMQSAGVDAKTLASFLHEESQRAATGETLDYSNTLFVIDEGSMIGNSDMAKAYSLIAAGNGRAVISGDEDQLQSISPGQPFKLQQGRSPIDVAVMKDIVRQTPQLREAVYKIIDRDIPAALAVVESVGPQSVPRREGAWVPDSSVYEWNQKQAEIEGKKPDSDPQQLALMGAEPREPVTIHDAIMKDYFGRTDAARANTLIITGLNSDRHAVNAMIHDERSKNAELGKGSVNLEILATANIKQGGLRKVATWESHAHATALLDNTYYRITSVDKENQLISLADAVGNERLISPREAVSEGVTLYLRESVEVSAGDKMRFTKSDVERGYVANSVWEVSSVEGDSVTIKSGNETRTLLPGLKQEDRHIDLAYAITAHGSQGAGEPFAITLQGVEGARKSLVNHASVYVPLSRAKQHVQVYTDDKAGWLKAVEKARERNTAHDILFAGQDKDSSVAGRLLEKAKGFNETALGRSLLKQNDLTGQTMAKYISPGKKYPQPHVALPAYDRNGKPAGAWLGALTADSGEMQGLAQTGRVLGGDQAQFVALQASKNGETRLADNISSAIKLAAANPESGVIFRLKGEGGPYNPGAMTGGKVWVEDGVIKQQTANQESEHQVVPLPETPDEKLQRELTKQAEKIAQEAALKGVHRGIDLPEDKIREIANDVLGEAKQVDSRLTDALLNKIDQAQLGQNSDASTIQKVAREDLQRTRLQQVEQGMVREHIQEKTLGGD